MMIRILIATALLLVCGPLVIIGCSRCAGPEVEYTTYDNVEPAPKSDLNRDGDRVASDEPESPRVALMPLVAPRPDLQTGGEFFAVREPVSAPRPDAAIASNMETAAGVASLDDPLEDLVLTPKLLIPNKTFDTVGRNNAILLSYDDIDLMKVLNMQPVPGDAVEMFPDWLKDLDGQRVRIRGFMYPTNFSEGLDRFYLARDNGICCFVRKPLIYDMFGVKLRDGVTTDYIEGRPFSVEGIFHILPIYKDGHWLRLYKITDATLPRY